jgi:CubicO group peptidase (beta-lactamase class C family)
MTETYAEADLDTTPPASYYPARESEGGWRWLRSDDQIRSVGGMDPEKLQLACELHERYEGPSSAVIIRNGYLVAEWYENNWHAPNRFNIWSGTKSFTATAFGILFDDSRNNATSSSGAPIELDTAAYPLIPEGHPLTDPRKEQITFRHLLTMTSGIAGEALGVYGVPTATGIGPFEAALGHAPLKARRWPGDRWASNLLADPGTSWDYSDVAMAHLSLAFFHVTGEELRDFMQRRVFDPIGIEEVGWDVLGGGRGLIGPHTNPHTGVHIAARELARFGYLMLRDGVWEGEQIVPQPWIELASQSSQEFNRQYGYLWWVNSDETLWPGVPKDAYSAWGFCCNSCYVIPSLDLVVVRLGQGPLEWTEEGFIKRVVDAVIDE